MFKEKLFGAMGSHPENLGENNIEGVPSVEQSEKMENAKKVIDNVMDDMFNKFNQGV